MVTEDSDALLFGAKTVYKNIFSDKKFVEVGGDCVSLATAYSIRHVCTTLHCTAGVPG